MMVERCLFNDDLGHHQDKEASRHQEDTKAKQGHV